VDAGQRQQVFAIGRVPLETLLQCADRLLLASRGMQRDGVHEGVARALRRCRRRRLEFLHGSLQVAGTRVRQAQCMAQRRVAGDHFQPREQGLARSLLVGLRALQVGEIDPGRHESGVDRLRLAIGRLCPGGVAA